jgi:hypothetical protein
MKTTTQKDPAALIQQDCHTDEMSITISPSENEKNIRQPPGPFI